MNQYATNPQNPHGNVIQAFKESTVAVVHMDDGRVLIIRNRFGLQGQWVPTKEQWLTKLKELREVNGENFKLLELSQEQAERSLKGRVNLW